MKKTVNNTNKKNSTKKIGKKMLNVYNNSNNEHEVLCEKIINDLHAVFLRETQLSSFEIIPTVLNQNKSPVIQINQNVGLESWCVKHVYHHAHNMLKLLMGKYRSQNFGKLLKRYYVDDGGGDDGKIEKNVDENNALVKYLNVALLINPDVISFWHLRRQLVNNKHLNATEELKFTVLVLSKKPKSSETFAYRRWLLTTILQESKDGIDWQLELNLCEYCADRCPNNYHAWSHRQWLLKTTKDYSQLLAKEISLTETFLLKHISDYSAYHYRQFLIIHANQKNYYKETNIDDDLLLDLQKLLKYYMEQTDEISYSRSRVLHIMLPGVEIEGGSTWQQNLQSFLYCCNLSAHDIHLMAEQKCLYGERESFELHRCASLKFITEKCQLFLLEHAKKNQKTRVPAYFITNINIVNQQQQRTFLSAIQKMESLLGQKQRKWCSLFLRFLNEDEQQTLPEY